MSAKFQHMARAIKILIPDDIDFSDLDLRRGADGDIKFSWRPIERICAASGIDISDFTDSPEENIASLIVHWYADHLRRGGDRDPVHDDLIAEMSAEDEHGSGISHPPGTA